MKDVKDTLLERRSIRRYEREAVTPEQMQFIFDATPPQATTASNTP